MCNGASGQVRSRCCAAATVYYCHYRQLYIPAKRDFKPHKLSPASPCAGSLIKIERTHVPISHLLQGCCGVYASSLYAGTKFEYHLHLAGRQWILHQKIHSAPLLTFSLAPAPPQRGRPDDISWEQGLSFVCLQIHLIRPLLVTEAHPSWRGTF